ncbi:hypothetical protein [Aeromonas phage AS-yj]|uniref:Uncharacterized protein n=1 Tax=Aeromonas phage AS-yj TaxID=2026115 RepID=A0A291LEG8_9CAUD|nr:hypothetical protein [Aeromonas phage AS-yj]
MKEFMTKIGYTLISSVEEFDKFSTLIMKEHNFCDRSFMGRDYEESEFPLYMKPVITGDNGYGLSILNFSTVEVDMV